MNNKNQSVILIVSSGTSNKKARKNNIEVLENRISEKFPGYSVRRAFTSYKIINKIKIEEGIDIDCPREALEKLVKEGTTQVVIQPLHIIPGSEYQKLLKEVEAYKGKFKEIVVGTPLLYEEDDYLLVIKALKKSLPEITEKQAVVMVGHGSSHEAQRCYLTLQNYLDKALFKGYVGTISGEPGILYVIELLKKKEIKEVVLMPFMLVAGNHAIVDIVSEKENSWKSMLIEQWFQVESYLKGLGELKEIQDIYINKIEDIMP